MPAYNYSCQTCKTVTEKIMTFEEFDKSRSRKFKCSECGGRLTRFISTPPEIKFVGKGFYSTDYPKKEKTWKRSKKQSLAISTD